MFDSERTGAIRIATNGNLIITVANFDVHVDLTIDELRDMAAALAIAADLREGKQPRTEALAIPESARRPASIDASDKVIAVERIEIESAGVHMIMTLIAGQAVLRVLLDEDRFDELVAGFSAHAAGLEAVRSHTIRLHQ